MSKPDKQKDVEKRREPRRERPLLIAFGRRDGQANTAVADLNTGLSLILIPTH